MFQRMVRRAKKVVSISLAKVKGLFFHMQLSDFQRALQKSYGIRSESITSPRKLHEADQIDIPLNRVDRLRVMDQCSSGEPWLFYNSNHHYLASQEGQSETLEK